MNKLLYISLISSFNFISSKNIFLFSVHKGMGVSGFLCSESADIPGSHQSTRAPIFPTFLSSESTDIPGSLSYKTRTFLIPTPTSP